MIPQRHSAAKLPGVLIVDDSAVARAVISRMLGDSKKFAVVGAVADAGAALDFLKRTPVDAIVLDLDMPGADGFAALPELIAAGAGAPVLVVSSACEDGADATIRALALGAADTLVKPGIGNFAGRFAVTLRERLALLLKDGADAAPVAGYTRSRIDPAEFDIIAIGASTGGIHALSRVLGALTSDVTQPILVTQHLPASFTPYLATQVALFGKRPCDIAKDRMRLRPGRITIAPGDAHIRCVRLSDGAALRLSTEPMPSGCMPSVDPMLSSVAEVFGPRALAIVLSGIGRDGSIGAGDIARTGGGLVVQDQASSVVWGMPGAIARAGIADAILSPDAIGQLIASGRRPA